MRGEPVRAFGRPLIDGYRVWRGRRLLHARFVGSLAQSRAQGRPWHVVAPTLPELIRQAHGQAVENRWGQW